MTSLLLIDELVRKLQKIFSGYTLLNKSGQLQEVQIYAQYLPQPQGISITNKKSGLKNYSETDYESRFPCVIVKHDGLTDYEEHAPDTSTCNIKILAGIYDENEDCQGYRDVLNIQERIREDFLKERILAERFLLKMPLTSKILEEDTWPIYFGEQEMKFEMYRPKMRDYIYHARRK